MTSRENASRAIHFGSPEYTPLLIFGQKRIEQSDMVQLAVEQMFGGHNGLISEWGFEWHANDTQFALGQIKRPAISGWEELDGLTGFDVHRPGRFDEARRVMKQYPDKYYVADFVLSGFTIMLFMRGFEELMVDFFEEPQQVERLADFVFSKEEELMRACAQEGFQAIELADDWGSQKALLTSPELFRRVFKPRYQQQIALAHELGLDVILHSCGYILDIVPDLIEIGLDVLNPGQPSLNGIEALGAYRGQICFLNPVGYQTTAISEDEALIEQEILSYLDHFSTGKGGFVGLVAQRLMELGVSEKTQNAVTSLWLKHCGMGNPYPN